MLTLAMLQRQWPHGDIRTPGLVEAITDQAPALFAKYGVTTPTIAAVFMGQVSLECGAGYEVEENLNYTAQRMCEVWPHRFPTLAGAEVYQHNPEALANNVYGGRMGNTQPGDGWKYRGRGGCQTTGHDGYLALQKVTGLPLLDYPSLVNNPKYFLLCALADFVACGCMPYAQAGDVVGTTRKLNGGETGLADREIWTRRWFREFGAMPFLQAAPACPAPAQPSPPVAAPPAAPTDTPAPAEAPHARPGLIGSMLAILSNQGKFHD